MEDSSWSLKFLWMAWMLSKCRKVEESRECFIEYSALAGQLARVSYSGLVWVTGQAYIKGLCVTRRDCNGS